MAQRRVPVERLRSTTRLQTVAAPVETYVRPAELPEQESELGAFVRAIAPAAETVAKLEREKQLKQKREAEAGIAAARTLDARLGLGKIQRELNQDYVDNQFFYLTASDEEITERRQELSSPLLEKAQASGDDLLVTALQGDLEVANLKFFGETLDPARSAQNEAKILSDLGTEIYSISAATNPNDAEAMAAATQQIDALVLATHNATGLPKNVLNTHIYNNFYLPDAASQGRNATHAWLESRNIPTTGENLPNLGKLNSRLAAYDKAIAEQNAVGQYQDILQQNVSAYISQEGVNKDVLQIGETVTLADGSTKKISEDDVEDALWLNYLNEWDSYSQTLQNLPPPARANVEKVNFNEAYGIFAKAGLMPPPMRNDLVSGASTLTSPENLTDKENIERAGKALAAYIQAEAYGITIPDKVLSKEQKQRFMVADVLRNQVGLNETSSLIAASNANLSLLNVNMNEKTAMAILDTATFSEDLSDVKNIQDMRSRVKEVAGVLLSTERMSIEDAVKQAVAVVEKDTKIISGSNGTIIGIELLNTGITRNGGEETRIEENLLIASEYPKIKMMMQYYGGAGLVVTNSNNDNLLALSIVDADGATRQTLGYVELADFSSKERLIELMLGKRKDLIEKGDYDPEAPTELTVGVPKAAISMGSQIQEMFPEALETIRNQFPDGSVMDLMLRDIQDGNTVVFEPPIMDIPEDMRVETITPLTDINGKETPFFLYAGRMPDGEPMFIKSLQSPDKYTGTDASVTEPMPSDIGVPEAPAPTFSDIQNVTTSFSTERERQQRDSYKNLPEASDTKGASIGDIVSALNPIGSANASETPSEIPSEAPEGKDIESFDMIEGTTTEDKVLNLLKEHEGFSSTPYADGKAQSVGYGFYLPSLTPDEKALIKDINNVTQEEAEAVLKVKVGKIQDFLADQLPMFDTLNGEQQSSIISMAYQLGSENIVKKFPTFFVNLKKATEAKIGSSERLEFLKTAAGNMLYNYNKQGEVVSETLWNQQTPNRATAMANGLLMENPMSDGISRVAEYNQKQYDAILQKAKNFAETNPEGMLGMLDKAVAETASEIIPSHFKAFAQDIFKIDLDTARTEDFFRGEEKAAMKDIVLASIKRTGNATSGSVSYDDYETGFADVTWARNIDPLSLGNAQGAVKKTLGQFNWRINEDGDLIITDRYNFNDAEQYNKQYPTPAAKAKHLIGLGLKVSSGEMSTYGWLRRVGALYGSKEGEGATFEINLGKIQ